MIQPTALEPNFDVLHVSGRAFRPTAATTFEQDIYIMSLLKEAGLVKLGAGFDPMKDTDLDEIAQSVIIEAFASGKLFDILSATLEEVGVPWSIPEARKNAQFFSQLTSDADKQSLYASITGALLGFFVSAASSSSTSRKYSLRPKSPVERLADESNLPVPSVDSTTMETGTTLSETSPAPTPT